MLHAVQPCPKDIGAYLEAAYTCAPGLYVYSVLYHVLKYCTMIRVRYCDTCMVLSYVYGTMIPLSYYGTNNYKCTMILLRYYDTIIVLWYYYCAMILLRYYATIICTMILLLYYKTSWYYDTCMVP